MSGCSAVVEFGAPTVVGKGAVASFGLLHSAGQDHMFSGFLVQRRSHVYVGSRPMLAIARQGVAISHERVPDVGLGLVEACSYDTCSETVYSTLFRRCDADLLYRLDCRGVDYGWVCGFIVYAVHMCPSACDAPGGRRPGAGAHQVFSAWLRRHPQRTYTQRTLILWGASSFRP